MITGFFQDVKLASRSLTLRWRFSLLVVVTMAIGIGMVPPSGDLL